MGETRWILATLLMVLVASCGGDGTDKLAETIQKYENVSEADAGILISDTEEFWDDVDLLYSASLRGNREAIRAIFMIGSHTDGHVAEGMPDDRSELPERWRDVCRSVILGNDRLRDNFGHLVSEVD